MTRELVDICICTFRRTSLTATLASIAGQTLPPGVGIRVIVADNDSTDCRRQAIAADAAELGLDLTYLHAPRHNISIARNACLTAATSDWLAFIDDDEVAGTDWLAKLLTCRSDTIVFGMVQAVYADHQAPRWMVEGDFHSTQVSGNDAAWNGYCGNVLIDRRFIVQHGLQFAESFGQIGGEDTLFFHDAHRRGASFCYAHDAIVTEPVPSARANLRWLALRRYRSGQIHTQILRRSKTAGVGAVAAAAKAAACLILAAVTLVRPSQAVGFALRGALHLGVVAAALGFAPYREYAVIDEAAADDAAAKVARR